MPCQVVASDFTVDGISYNITSAEEHTVAVTSGTDKYVDSVVIPETVAYDGGIYSVTAIGEVAFYNCSGLVSVTIPNSVRTIGSWAFENCIGLTSITIPNSVTYIGIRAFYSCSGLTSITIPNSVTYIDTYAFKHCSSLISITIPNSVTTISRDAFSFCDSLVCIVVDADNPVYDSRDNCNAIIKTSSNTLICGCKNTIIPNSVTTIGDYAFAGCSSLISITIPNSVTTIGYSAFSDCSSLISITIPNSVTTIGSAAFCYCSSLPSITIPNSVTTIGRNTFAFCSGLTSIGIPNSVTTIDDMAFQCCSSLEYIVVDAGNPVYDSRENCNAIIETSSNTLICGCKNTIIPNSVTSIGSGAFFGCTGLTSITIPNSVTAIGNYAFSGCSALTSIVIPNSVTTIGDYAFNSCSALKDFYCHAESVPTADYYIFSRVNLFSATLHVPEASLQEYGSVAPWNEFGQIVALTESDGIERLTSEANSPTIAYGLDGRRVAKPRKGIYVIGGRKTVVK